MKLPTHFHFAREIGGMRAVDADGSTTGRADGASGKRRGGKSVLQALLRDNETNEWLDQKQEQLALNTPEKFRPGAIVKRRRDHKQERQATKTAINKTEKKQRKKEMKASRR
eukprot:Selendium_serpulae@DN2021_c0_g1_i2.p1